MWPLLPAAPPYYLLVDAGNISTILYDNLTLGPTTPAPCLELAGCQWNSPADNYTDPLIQNFYARWPVSQWTYFTEDYLKLVNRHWLAFPPPSKNQYLAFMLFYCLLALFGLTGNALVVFMISRCRSLRTPSNLLVLNLAASDFLILCEAPLFIYNSIKEGPALGSVGCQVYGFVGGCTGTCAIMTLAAIALDRYYVIAYPLKRDYHTTRIRAIIWIILIWLYSLFFSAIPLVNIGIKPYVPEGFLTSCSFDYLDDSRNNRIFILVFFCAAWLIPFIIICMSYVGICRAVLLVSMATRRDQEKEKRRKEIRLAIVVIFVIALWFIAWTPYAAVSLLGIFGHKDLITPIASMLPAIFCKSASCIDPFIYSLNHPRLRKELFKVICPKKYEMYRIETQKSLFNFKESRSSLNQYDTRSRANQPEELDLEDVGEPWKHKGTLNQSERSNRSASVKSEVLSI